MRLAYLVTHPIQYQAPLLRRIAAEPGIELTVFFQSDISTRAFHDPGFDRVVHWDTPLLEGYKYHFLPAIGDRDRLSFCKPLNYGLSKFLAAGHFDALWVHGYMRPFHWAAILSAKKRGIRVLIRDDVHGQSKNRGFARRMAKQGFFAALRLLVDRYLAIGRLNRDYYLSLGAKPETIFTMPYAVDNQFFRTRASEAHMRREQLRSDLGLEKGRPIILYAGRLVEAKRPEDLLVAYARLSPNGRSEPSPYLLFVGDGPRRSVLQVAVASLGWNSVKILGFKNQTELPAYYDLCDVFVMPSDIEPWGLVVNEAMNAAKAMIVSDRCGCYPDLVKDGVNGYVFRAGDVGHLREAIEQVLTDPERCRKMGDESLKIINQWGIEQNISVLRAALGIENMVQTPKAPPIVSVASPLADPGPPR